MVRKPGASPLAARTRSPPTGRRRPAGALGPPGTAGLGEPLRRRRDHGGRLRLGRVLLGVEIAASRVLAPFFGNSLYVWGSLIGVVLTGLAIGYWLGGVLADRLPVTGLLLGVMGLAALSVLAIPFVDDAVLEAVVGWDAGPRLNPLLAAVILFGPMSVLMACVTPIAVRLRARSLARVGRTAGRLFSVSTAGSIAGTLATAFFLIPSSASTSSSPRGRPRSSLPCSSSPWPSGRRSPPSSRRWRPAGAVVAAVSLAPETGGTLSGAAAQNWSPLYRLRGSETVLDARDPRAAIAQPELEVVFSEDTQYHRLSVVEDADTRYLRFDNSLQSAMYIDDPLRTRFAYTDLFHLSMAYNPEARDILFIGLGAGSSEKRMLQDFADAQLQAVEIDPVVAEVAHDYFEVPATIRGSRSTSATAAASSPTTTRAGTRSSSTPSSPTRSRSTS